MDSLLLKSFTSLLVGAVSFGIYKICKIIWFVKYKCYIFRDNKKNLVHSETLSFRECVEETIALLKRNPTAYRVLGMDCEMTSNSGNGGFPVPAILQLATPDGYCVVYKVKKMEASKYYISSNSNYPSRIPLPSSLTVLAQILEDPTILKVGVGVMNDARYLENKYGLVTKGCLDVRHLACEVNIKPRGLDELGKELLGQGKVDYGGKRRVPWEADIVPEMQMKYAVQDSRLGVDIFLELSKRYMFHHYSLCERLFWDEQTFWKYTIKHFEKFIGKQFSIKNRDENTKIDCNSWKKYISITVKSLYKPEGACVPESAYLDCFCRVCHHICTKVFVTPVVPVDYDVGNPEFRALCKHCLEISQKENYIIRKKLTLICGAPYPDYEDIRLIKAKKLATTLKTTDPQSEQYELYQYRLCEMLDMSRNQLRKGTLEVILTMDCWPGSSHGQFVHDYYEYIQPNKLNELQQFWKEERRNLKFRYLRF